MQKTDVARGPRSRSVSATDNLVDTSFPQSQARRRFLRRGVVLAGATAASATGIAAARAQRLEIPQSNLEMGHIIEPTAYGVPSKFEAHVARRRTDVLVNKQNWSDWSMTPIQSQLGIVTPNGLFFERHHAGVPDINPDQHQLVIHGIFAQVIEPQARAEGGHDVVRDLVGIAARPDPPARVRVDEAGLDASQHHRRVHGGEDHPAARPAESAQLPEAAGQVGDVFADEAAEHAVEGGTFQGQPLRQVVTDKPNGVRTRQSSERRDRFGL